MARILVVDDEETIRRALEKRLVKLGHEAVAACDGVDAWSRLAREQFDLLITDYKMPRMDGMALLARIREGGISLPVIVITGTSTENPRMFLEHGAVAYLLKPIAREELEAALARALAGSPGF
jgi:CheY-like chemotaxis protein